MSRLIKGFSKEHVLYFLVLLFSLISAFLILDVASKINSDKSLVLLASQFLDKHISLSPNSSLPLGDISFFNGRFYLSWHHDCYRAGITIDRQR